MLTGKAKELFEKWYFKKYCKSGKDVIFDELWPHQYHEIYDWFYSLPDSMQWGVYQDFAESTKHTINTATFIMKSGNIYYCVLYWDNLRYNEKHSSKEEARTAAIKKLNELINK